MFTRKGKPKIQTLVTQKVVWDCVATFTSAESLLQQQSLRPPLSSFLPSQPSWAVHSNLHFNMMQGDLLHIEVCKLQLEKPHISQTAARV